MVSLITGASGFVGVHLHSYLIGLGDEVIDLDTTVDICNVAQLNDELSRLSHLKIDSVYHLAAMANVHDSFSELAAVFEVNVVGTVNLLQALRIYFPSARVVVVSSSEVYGTSRNQSELLNEELDIAPLSPYAASKAAAEIAALQAFRAYGQKVVVARPFNHIGPGQSDRYVVSALAKRMLLAKRASEDSIPIGNLDSKRDFCDVRDVVRSYKRMMELGRPGEIYNVCSGISISISELADMLMSISGYDGQLVVDADLARKIEVTDLRGDITKVHSELGWERQISIERSLTDVLNWWSNHL